MDIKIVEGIVEQFCRVLKEHNYPFDKSAVRKIVSASLERKKDLIELFSKHPKWVPEQLCIHFEHDYERKTDPDAYHDFLNWLYEEASSGHKLVTFGKVRMNVNSSAVEAIPEDKLAESGVLVEELEAINKIIVFERKQLWSSRRVNMFEALCELPAETLLPAYNDTEGLTDSERREKERYEALLKSFNALDEHWNFRPGMKLNRVIGKICTKYGWNKLPDYEKQYAKFSDAMNPLRVKRQTTISVNPVDFLLMSNGNSWNSCHWIGWGDGDGGRYSSGTVSYMMGRDSFIMSAIDEDASGDNLAEEKKILRQTFGYKDGQLIQSRLYPQNCDNGAKELYDNIRGMVEEIIASAEGEPNLWTKQPQNVSSYGTAYQDWEYNNLCKMYVLNSRLDDNTVHDSIIMSGEPICVKCGGTHMYEESIVCEDCNGSRTCADCGCSIDFGDEDRYIYDNSNGYYYCTECRVRCDRCGCVERRGYTTWISDIDETWCEYCTGNYASQCIECNEWVSEPYAKDEEGRTICESCYDNHYTRCEGCGNPVRNEDVVEIEGVSYCAQCAEEIKEKMEETA